jgi:hypothetical protein
VGREQLVDLPAALGELAVREDPLLHAAYTSRSRLRGGSAASACRPTWCCTTPT